MAYEPKLKISAREESGKLAELVIVDEADTYNLPTVVVKGPRNVKKARALLPGVKTMSEVQQRLNHLGIRYSYYCAVD